MATQKNFSFVPPETKWVVCPPSTLDPKMSWRLPPKQNSAVSGLRSSRFAFGKRGMGRGMGAKGISDSEKEELLPLLSLKDKRTWNTLWFVFHVYMPLITSYATEVSQGKKRTRDHSGGLALGNFVTGDSVASGLQVRCLPDDKREMHLQIILALPSPAFCWCKMILASKT